MLLRRWTPLCLAVYVHHASMQVAGIPMREARKGNAQTLAKALAEQCYSESRSQMSARLQPTPLHGAPPAVAARLRIAGTPTPFGHGQAQAAPAAASSGRSSCCTSSGSSTTTSSSTRMLELVPYNGAHWASGLSLVRGGGTTRSDPPALSACCRSIQYAEVLFF